MGTTLSSPMTVPPFSIRRKGGETPKAATATRGRRRHAHWLTLARSHSPPLSPANSRDALRSPANRVLRRTVATPPAGAVPLRPQAIAAIPNAPSKRGGAVMATPGLDLRRRGGDTTDPRRGSGNSEDLSAVAEGGSPRLLSMRGSSCRGAPAGTAPLRHPARTTATAGQTSRRAMRTPFSPSRWRPPGRAASSRPTPQPSRDAGPPGRETKRRRHQRPIAAPGSSSRAGPGSGTTWIPPAAPPS